MAEQLSKSNDSLLDCTPKVSPTLSLNLSRKYDGAASARFFVIEVIITSTNSESSKFHTGVSDGSVSITLGESSINLVDANLFSSGGLLLSNLSFLFSGELNRCRV